MESNLKPASIIYFLALFMSCTEVPVTDLPSNNDDPEAAEPEPFLQWANTPENFNGTMFQTEEGVFYFGVQDGLVRSYDHGKSWERISDVQSPGYVYISPTEDRILLVRYSGYTSFAALYYSDDGGRSWKRPESPHNGTIHIYLELHCGKILAGGFVHEESVGGVFVSSDGGSNWELNSTLDWGHSIVSFAKDPSLQYFAALNYTFIRAEESAIYMSNDCGSGWTEIVSFDSLRIRDFLIDSQGVYYLITRTDILVSEDQATTWRVLEFPYVDPYLLDLIFDPRGNLVVAFHNWTTDKTEMAILPRGTNNWLLLGGINLERPNSYHCSFVGRDNHIYLSSSAKVFKSRMSIEQTLMTMATSRALRD